MPTNMKFKTAISQTKNNKHYIWGKDILELMDRHSFTEVIFLFLRGSLPKKNEQALLEAVLIAATENGIEAPSLFVPRVVAASGNEFHAALAAGMLSIGEKHGGAAGKAAELFSCGKSAEQIVKENKIIPGFGHKMYKDEDPRATLLHQKSKDLGFSGKYFEIAKEIEKILAEKKGRELPLNIDGAMACCMLELGLDAKLGKALFLIGRIVGMSAHILEEYKQGNSYYRLGEDEIEYQE